MLHKYLFRFALKKLKECTGFFFNGLIPFWLGFYLLPISNDLLPDTYLIKKDPVRGDCLQRKGNQNPALENHLCSDLKLMRAYVNVCKSHVNDLLVPVTPLVPGRDPWENPAGDMSLHCQEDGQNDPSFNFSGSLCTSPGLANSQILIKDIKPNNEAYNKRTADKAHSSRPPRAAYTARQWSRDQTRGGLAPDQTQELFRETPPWPAL